MSKATHSGHCQACGSLQKLPSGVLSKHGYKVTHGFFSGVCRGAGYQPFEISHDQVERYIAEAKADLQANRDWVAELRTRHGTSTKVFVSNYEKGRDGRSSYRQREVELIATRHDYESEGVQRSYFTFHYIAPGFRYNDGRDEKHEVTTYDGRDLMAQVKHMNEQTALGIEKREIKSLLNYIRWQEERVASWKPGTILPVTTKDDKQGFKPVE